MLMASKLIPSLFPWLILPTCVLIFLYSTLLPLYTTSKPRSPTPNIPLSPPSTCNLFNGKWVFDPTRRPMYDSTCPFQRTAWNCIKNQREKMGRINSWKWVPENCELNVVDPIGFLKLMRNRNIGFVGDSLNENFLVSFLCILRVADSGATKWKRKGAWRGAHFPKFNVTVAYHRAVLLAKYEWQTKQPKLSGQDGTKGMYRVNVDIPADDWANIAEFYDVLVFNTGHWWGEDKFPKETPLVFFQGGQPINPPLNMLDGLNIVLENMVDHIEKTFPRKTLKFWRLQSPRHFHGGEWNQNGSCLFEDPLKERQILCGGHLSSHDFFTWSVALTAHFTFLRAYLRRTYQNFQQSPKTKTGKMGPKILHTSSPNLLPQFTKSQTHTVLPNSTPAKSLPLNHKPRRTLKISCIKEKEPTTDETLAAELCLQIKHLNTSMLQREEALKKSRELLFAEVSNFTGLQPEDLKKKWRRMGEEERWVLVHGFVSEWSAHFHPLSARSVKEMVEEYLGEEGHLSDSGSGNLFPDFGKFLGFSQNIEE